MPGGGTRTFLEPDDYEVGLRQANIEAVIAPPASGERALVGRSCIICSCCGAWKIPRASPICSWPS
jgi:hypothetical protein